MCAGLAPRIRPRIPPPPCSCYTLRSAWPSTPSAVAGAARGTDISTPGIVLEHGEPACIGTHYTQRPHRCVRGAFKGAIASACGRASRPRSRPSAAPFLADGQDAVVDAKLLFKSRAERSRPWFAGAHFVSGLRVLVPLVRTRGFDARRSALARSRIAARVQNADMHVVVPTGGGAGDTGRCRTMSCSTRPFTPRPPPAT